MGLRIKEYRLAQKMSQETLAGKAGVSRSQLSEIENEVKPANTLRLNAIATALGVSVDELFDEAHTDVYKKRILELLEVLPEKQKKILIDLAESLSPEEG